MRPLVMKLETRSIDLYYMRGPPSKTRNEYRALSISVLDGSETGPSTGDWTRVGGGGPFILQGAPTSHPRMERVEVL